MLEKINEPVEVMVKFYKNQVVPTLFRWRKKTYAIEKVNLVHHEGHGEYRIYYFSVSDNANFFRLAFSTKDLGWTLQELYYES